MDPRIYSKIEANIQELILRGFETMNFLMSIKGFVDFDCQSCFLKNDGLRALLSIKTYSKNQLLLSHNIENKKIVDIQIQSKILLQMLS